MSDPTPTRSGMITTARTVASIWPLIVACVVIIGGWFGFDFRLRAVERGQDDLRKLVERIQDNTPTIAVVVQRLDDIERRIANNERRSDEQTRIMAELLSELRRYNASHGD